jgi:CrcB protein
MGTDCPELVTGSKDASLELTTVTDEPHLDAPRARAPNGPLRDPRMLVAVFAGGLLGGLLRTALEDWSPAATGWPWVTFIANLAGAALLGWAAVRLQERLAPSTYPRPFLGTGLCGGLTTFSTLQVEVVRLAHEGRTGMAAAYLGASLTGGAVVAFTTIRLVRRARWRA